MKTRSNLSPPALVVLVLAALIAISGAGCSREARKARHLERANRYFEANEYEKAQIEYLSVLRLDQSNLPAIRRLGTIYFEQGRLPQALIFLNQAKEMEPDNLDARAKLGAICLAAHRLKEAREEALYVLARQPANDDALVLLGEASATTNDIKQTWNFLQTLQPQAGNKVGFHLALGTLALRQQDLGHAEAAFRQALALDPKSSAGYIALGNLLWLKNDLKQAEQAFKTAAELAPPRSTRGMYYADFKIKTGDLEAAKRLLDDITRKTPDYLPARTRLAEVALVQKKYDDCGAILRRVLAQDPNNYDALMLSGKLKLAQGDPEKAVAEFERIGAAFNKVPQVHYFLGLACYLNNDFAKAAASLDQARALAPNYAEATLLLAELKLRRGDVASAIAVLTPLARQTPLIPQAHLMLANAYRAGRNPEAAVTVYRRLQEAYPKEPQIPVLLGLVCLDQNKKTDARQAFEKAIELAPDSMTALEQWVNVEVSEQRYAAAFQRVQLQVEKHPQWPEPQFLLARIHYANQETNRAEAALLKAIALAPNYTRAYYLLARLYVESHKHQQALERLRELVAKDPKDVAALMQIGMLQTELKNYPAARDAYEKIRTVNAQFAPALNNLAYLYCEGFKQFDQAYELARRARELAPNDPVSADTLGWILYYRGELSRALALLQESAERMPAQPEVLFHLGATHYLLGEEEAARLALQRALQSNQDFPGRPDAERKLKLLAINPQTAGPNELADLEKQSAETPRDQIVWSRLAAIYERSGAVAKAANAWQQVINLNPRNVPATVRLAQLYAGPLKNSATAMELARKAHALAPDDPAISHLLGRLAFEASDHKWALSLLQESARKLPQEPEALYDLAWACYSMGRLPDAEAAMKTAVQTGKAFSRADAAKQFLAVQTLYLQPEAARQSAARIQEILKADPNYLPALAVTGLLQEQQGNAKAAQQVYESILARHPYFAPAHKSLARLLAESPENVEKAYTHALKAREGFPDDPEVAKILGVIAYRRDDFPRAVQLLKESAGKRATDAEVFFYLGMAQYRLKQTAESKQSLNQALALNVPQKLAGEARRVLAELK